MSSTFDTAHLLEIIAIQNAVAAAGLDADAVMDLVVRRAAALTDADAAVVELVEGEEMVYRAAWGAAEPHVGLRLRKAASLSGLCVTRDEALRCDDSDVDPRVDAAACRRVGARSMICVPLRHGEAAVGVLKVWCGTPWGFGDADVALLGLLGGVIAAHLENAAAYRIAARDAALLLAEREQKERLEELDRVRQDLLSLVTHELQTPLTSILGYVEVLEDDEELPPEHRRMLQIVHRNAGRLTELVRDLLTVSRAEAGRLALRPEPVDVRQLVRDCVAEIRPLAEAERLELVVRCAAERPVHADPARLAQVVINLLSNAVKYTTPGGRVDVVVEDAGGRLRIRVSDTGIGIPRDEQDRMFERFFRASTALRAQVPGVGLGLAITKLIVDGHGGSIDLHSRPGRGTTFTVALPYADPGFTLDLAAPPAPPACADRAAAVLPARGAPPRRG